MELIVLSVSLAMLVALIVYLLRNSSDKLDRLPPSPKTDSIFGQSFQNWSNKDYLVKVAKSLGEIFRLRVFGQNIVVVNSYEAIKEAYCSDWIAGRGKAPFMTEISNGGLGIGFADGHLWKVHRRFCLNVLKDFGFGKSKSEASVQTELLCLCDAIKSVTAQAQAQAQAQAPRPFFPRTFFSTAVSNVITSFVFNERCSEDPEFETLIDDMQGFLSTSPRSMFFLGLWPIMKYFPGDPTGLKRCRTLRNRMYRYTKKKFEQHKMSFNRSNIRDYIDAFLAEIDNPQKDPSFSESQLCQVIMELFVAGTESTSTTMLWAIVYLVKHPEVQKLMKREIDANIGDSKVPQVSDRTLLPYCDAVIHEIQRCATLVPQGVPHRATEDGQLRGYDIPKDTVVISDLWNAHHSGSWWRDAEHFNPHNFLDDNGKLTNTQYLLSFSTGKRVCLGESLAKQELFVFIVGLVQRFEFKEDANCRISEEEDTVRESTVRSPIPYNVIARLRC